MASKYQEAYKRIDDLLCIALNNGVLIDDNGNKPKMEDAVKDIETLQQAINELELYKKAVEILIKQSMCNYTYDAWEKRILQLARKELENGK